MPDYEGLFRFFRKGRSLAALIRDRQWDRLAAEWDVHDEEVEDWLEQHPIPPLSDTAPVPIQSVQTGDAGQGTEASRYDHTHETISDAPLALGVGDAVNEGAALGTTQQRLRLVRATHRHGVPTGTPVAVGDANAEGVSTSFPRLDHVHAGGASVHGFARKREDQSFADLTEGTVEFDVLEELAGVEWDDATHRFVIVTDGLYLLAGSAKWEVSANGFRTLHLHADISGVVTLLDDDHPVAATTGYVVTNTIHATVALTAGDEVWVEAMTQDAFFDPLNILGQDRNSPWLSVTRIGPVPEVSDGDFILGLTNAGSTRTDFTGEVGCEFTVGDLPLTVTHLGRWRHGAGSSHYVKIVRKSDDTVMATVTSSWTNVVAGNMSYVALGASVVLAANTTYYLVVQTTNADAANPWSDTFPAPFYERPASLDWSVFRAGSSGAFTRQAGQECYGPVSFRYTV